MLGAWKGKTSLILLLLSKLMFIYPLLDVRSTHYLIMQTGKLRSGEVKSFVWNHIAGESRSESQTQGGRLQDPHT